MLSQFTRLVAKLVTTLFNSLPIIGGTSAYRPEKYYMRGPGPQWHAKHDHAR